MKMNIKNNVEQIIKNIGGKDNIKGVSHCATRLRFILKDISKANKEKIEKMNGILGVNVVGKEFQVIIGGDVVKYYSEIKSEIDINKAPHDQKEKVTLKSITMGLLDFIAGTMTPLIPALIGSSMIRGILILLTQFNLMDATSSTYAILFAASNTIFYFLPIIAAFSAAKKLDVNPYIAACIAGSLMEPNFTSLMSETGNIVDFLGLPVRMFSYSASLIPALLATWLYSIAWKWLEKKVPGSIAGVLNPAICLFIFVPLTAIIFGPVAYYFGQFIGWAFNSINGLSPVIAGIFIGVTMNYLVITGMHWVITAICLTEFANGYSILFGYWWCACISYIAIALGAIAVAKNKKERSLAISCSVVAIFGGVSEPTLYSYLLRNKKYAIPMAISGAIAGGLAGLLGCRATAFSMATIFTVPCVEIGGSFITAAIVFLIAIVAGIVSTVIFVGRSDSVDFALPISGKIIPLSDVNDTIFSSKTLGDGFAVIPNDNKVYAPTDAEVVSLYPTKHAIGLKDKNNNEYLIHVGIDTVYLNGEGFKVYVSQKDQVKKGQLLLAFDDQLMKDKGVDLTTPIVFMNGVSVEKIDSKVMESKTNLFRI